MTSITAQQTKLNLKLVPKENRLDIGKCNGIIPRGLKQKKETFQVALDALVLTRCYPAFVITIDVPEVYMHQFWNSVYKHHDFYRFKIDKKKRFKLTLEVFRDILQICPIIEDQDFDALSSEEDIVSFLRELGHTRVVNSLNDVVIDQMHQPWRTFTALFNRSLSGKTTALDKLFSFPSTYPLGHESKAYKTYLGYAIGTVPPKVARKFKKASPSKKDSVLVSSSESLLWKLSRKEKKKVDVAHGKGTDLLFEVALTEEAQMKEVGKKSLRDFHMSHSTGYGSVAENPPSVEKITPPITNEGTGDEPGVLDVTKDDSTESESQFEFDQKDDNDDEVKDDEVKDDDQSEGDEYREMDIDDVPDKKADVRMNDAKQVKENLEITQEQVIEDAHVTITKKTKVHVTSSSLSFDLASKFLNFSDIPPADTEIVSLMDVHVHHESTPSPLPTTKTSNIPPLISNFASVFRFNDRVIALEKDVAKLKNDPLHTQVTSITEQVRSQLPQILPEEVSNFAPPVIEKMIQESLNQVNMAKASFQSQSSYEAAATLTEFELKNILINKINSSESYQTALEHPKCCDCRDDKDKDERPSAGSDEGLKKRKTSKYAKTATSPKTKDSSSNQDDKDKDERPSAGSDEGLKKRKTSKYAKTTTSPKTKDSSSKSSKGNKSQPKSSGKSVHAEEPEFKVGDTNTPQGQEGNQGNDNDEPKTESASRRTWFTKPSRPQEPTNLDWNEDKTPQTGPTQNWLMSLAASTSTGKSLKEFDELMSTPIEFSSYILNGLKIENLTQEILLGPSFRLLKGTRLNYAKLEYDFEECYKALSEKLDCKNPEGGDYPFDLSKPLPLITHRNHQSVPVEFFINNDLKYLQGGISTMIYPTSTAKTKAAQYDLPGIKDMDCDRIPKRPTMYLNLWRYKVVRHRYSNSMIQPEPKGSTQGYLPDTVEVPSHHRPSDAMHNPSQPLKVRQTLFQNSRRFTHFYRISHSDLVGIEKVAISFSLRLLKLKVHYQV
uniref:Uncharacterized protein n=1 Tax=Tanacetum cinerariifolium TaxID=118510 RepID=A0A6L2NYQ7_TANCI|nr:hypothetical protein [Tanacetum cinerariifolium]